MNSNSPVLLGVFAAQIGPCMCQIGESNTKKKIILWEGLGAVWDPSFV
jgi:hypothetical protein